MKPSNNSQVQLLQREKEKYKIKAIAAKRNNDKETAVTLLKYMKVCDVLIEDAKAGRYVDMSALQPEESSRQTSSTSDETHNAPTVDENEATLTEKELYGAPDAPKTITEALNQRLQKYRSEESKAKEAGNSSKARRMGRICKQYEEAIKFHRAGKPLPGGLPDPPGFAPIPLSDPPPSATKPVNKQAPTTSGVAISGAVPVASLTLNPDTSGQEHPTTKVSTSKKSATMSIQEKQLASLLKRQKLFKEAALAAKQQGQTDTAKEYLKQALSFNKLIEVSKGGLPVDMGTLPVPPQMQVSTHHIF